MAAISVIVPTRQRNHLLSRCLQSLYGQTFRDFEIILIDDNPPESRIAKDPAMNGLLADRRLRLIENPKPLNAAAARNFGLPEARGDWVTYLDDDDTYRPCKLERQLQRAREAKVPLTSCGLTYRLAGRTRTCNKGRTEFVGDELLLQFPGMQTLFHQRANVLFNEALPAVHDLYFYQELLRAFGLSRVCNVPESLVDRYLHRGPRVSWNADSVWRGHLAVCRDFGSRYSSAASEILLLRARLKYCNMRGGMLGELVRVSWRLAKLRGGRKEARAILGSLLFQVPFLRGSIVS